MANGSKATSPITEGGQRAISGQNISDVDIPSAVAPA